MSLKLEKSRESLFKTVAALLGYEKSKAETKEIVFTAKFFWKEKRFHWHLGEMNQASIYGENWVRLQRLIKINHILLFSYYRDLDAKDKLKGSAVH